MIMGFIWTGMVLLSIVSALGSGQGGALAAAAMGGAQEGITLSVAIGGSLCLWSGVGKLMEKSGITRALSFLLRPLLYSVFPDSRRDPVLAGALSANITANFLGLGNAATPMGIQAAKRLNRDHSDIASHQLCRLIVLNTASIQFLPTNVAAIRAGLGCAAPFDILAPVWITSLLSAGLGVTAALILGRVWKQ